MASDKITAAQWKALTKFRNAVRALDKAGMSVFVAAGTICVFTTPNLPFKGSRGSVDERKEHYEVVHQNAWDGGDW